MDKIKNISEFDYIFKKQLIIKLDRIKLPSKTDEKVVKTDEKVVKNCEQNKRITRSAKKEDVQTEWVRILNGLYKGDIAHVEHWSLQKKELILKIIPRIANGASKRRPCAKRFDPELIKYAHFFNFFLYTQ